MSIEVGPIGRAPADVAAAVALFAYTLGEGVYSEPGLLELDAYDRGLGLAARDSGRLVAVSVAQALAIEDNGYYDLFGDPARRRLDGHVLGSVEGLAVEPAWRKQGLGTRLATASLDWLTEMGCELAVAISWLGQPSNPSWPLFERLGFEAAGESAEVYTLDSQENGWSCPVDGHPCHCTGRLYVRSLQIVS